ncbi:para-aminobenzoate synthetase component 1 [Methylohalomonas lacus]|uniref:aminodeoxychorismate synthase n=1 Tax=Methylohalomonas lacus TaxID=398773 RepID=A0AAE3HN54_9GAMM|nr:aminodeoxychorismate synthase component I [Methylohalomonas lacus]MCS3904473.1 para-aminobenzoate synthetase component 1 [Methylohalomonas lacus]
MKHIEIAYQSDPTIQFSHLAHEPWAVLLDSGYPHISRGRYDIFAARPTRTLTTRGGITRIETSDGAISDSEADPFALLRDALGERSPNHTGLPFCGGALGYFGYDLGRRIETLPQIAEHDIDLPDMAIGIYDWTVVIDHHQRRSWLVTECRDPRTAGQADALRSLFNGPGATSELAPFAVTSDIRANMDEQQYADAFERIKHYIREGDCYQVNLAQRFSVDVSGDPWLAYLNLRSINPAPYAGFMRLPEGAVLSSSPERFLKLEDDRVETKPIKGTRARGTKGYEDLAVADQLIHSEKDRAENVMIVDLLRNDIGKNCRMGSVSVPKLFALESFATVHHLVSTVTGTLADGRHALDLLRGCFPGGSITGAPKVRAMEIIEELEPHRRSIYCGSLGYIGFDGDMDTNIAIRTLVQYNDRMHCWAGGGIVNDSTRESEYQESFDKAAAMLKVLGTDHYPQAAGE